MRGDKGILVRRFFSSLTYAILMSVLYLFLKDERGLEEHRIGAIFSILLLTNQAGTLLAGVLGDRFGHRKPMLLGCAFDLVGYVLMAFARGFPALVMASVLLGVGGTLFSTNARARLLALAKGDAKEGVLRQSRFDLATNFSVLIAPAFTYAILKSQEYRTGMLALGLVEALVLAVVFREFRSWDEDDGLPRASASLWGNAREVLSPAFLKLHLVALLPSAVLSSFTVIIPFVFSERLGRPELVGVAFFMSGVVLVGLQGKVAPDLFRRRLEAKVIGPATLVMVLSAAALCFVGNVLASYLLVIIFSVFRLYFSVALSSGLVLLAKRGTQTGTFAFSKLLLAVSSSVAAYFAPVLLARSNVSRDGAMSALATTATWAAVVGGCLVLFWVLKARPVPERAEGIPDAI